MGHFKDFGKKSELYQILKNNASKDHYLNFCKTALFSVFFVLSRSQSYDFAMSVSLSELEDQLINHDKIESKGNISILGTW